MKIYAEFIEDDGLLFRTKTLLQFGDSWDLIGSIVMKNPGSAKPENSMSWTPAFAGVTNISVLR